MNPIDLPPSIRLSELSPGFPVLHINHAEATGCVALHGAHVMEWTPKAQRPVLYMSPNSPMQAGKPIRGGIPICWPWFGPRADAPQLPGHGFARLHPWTLDSALAEDAGVVLKLSLTESPATLAMWPHAFRLQLTIAMGDTLWVALSMEHRGSEPVEITGALHTYLTVGAIEQTSVLGLESATYLDSLENHARKSQQGAVVFDREVDRIYESKDKVRVEDQAWQRDILVSKTGSAATVVWNPWIEKSKRLADLPDEAYHGFLCIEAANAGDDIIRLQPGQKHLLSQTLGPVGRL
jgi:glucose-6-phosphate 1-epimerase